MKYSKVFSYFSRLIFGVKLFFWGISSVCLLIKSTNFFGGKSILFRGEKNLSTLFNKFLSSNRKKVNS